MITGLFIAIPTRDNIHIRTALSLFDVVAEHARQGIMHTVRYYSSSDIAISRNRLAAAFLNEDAYSHILFVDSDMEFDPLVFDGLARINKPFTACVYPKRWLDLEKFRKTIEAEATKPPKDRVSTSELLSATYDFTIRSLDYDEKPWPFVARDGYISVPGVGFGLVLLSREVFVSMIENDCVAPFAPKGERFPRAISYGFFNPIARPDGEGWISEDYSFCKRWVADCSGEIWVLGAPTINHIGDFVFSGSLNEHLRRLHNAPVRGEKN